MPKRHSTSKPSSAPARIRSGTAVTTLLHPHPLAAIVPEMRPGVYATFLQDVRAHGIDAPLCVTTAGVILDGRHRHRAALEIGLQRVPVRVVSPTDELAFLVRAAVNRRQLTKSQAAAVAVAYFDQLDHAPSGRRRDQIAHLAGVSPRLAQHAATVHNHNAELFAQILQGEIKAHRAASQVTRRQRDAALDTPPLPEGCFDVILADPPWPSADPDAPSAPEQHYPTMPITEICDLQVPAADDAALYLWAVNGQLPQALRVAEAWGFTYKGNFAWPKQNGGRGAWILDAHELLLFAIRGTWKPAEPRNRPLSVLDEPGGQRHSQKPEIAYQQIERMYPHAARVELFARTTRPGWTAWGNQAPSEEAA